MSLKNSKLEMKKYAKKEFETLEAFFSSVLKKNLSFYHRQLFLIYRVYFMNFVRIGTPTISKLFSRFFPNLDKKRKKLYQQLIIQTKCAQIYF